MWMSEDLLPLISNTSSKLYRATLNCYSPPHDCLFSKKIKNRMQRDFDLVPPSRWKLLMAMFVQQLPSQYW